jgi:hypothetical protein
MTLELMYAGRIDGHDAVQIAARTLGRQRISYLDEPGPPWRRRGVFSTWHRGGRGTDLIDCTVNANALALFASLGLLHLPGVAQSVEMLVAAIYWAGEHRSRATSLSPFYPECAEFVAALGNAVAAGVEDLEETYRVASAASWAEPSTTDPDRYAICSSPYGAVNWFSPTLLRLRAHGYSL